MITVCICINDVSDAVAGSTCTDHHCEEMEGVTGQYLVDCKIKENSNVQVTTYN